MADQPNEDTTLLSCEIARIEGSATYSAQGLFELSKRWGDGEPAARCSNGDLGRGRWRTEYHLIPAVPAPLAATGRAPS